VTAPVVNNFVFLTGIAFSNGNTLSDGKRLATAFFQNRKILLSLPLLNSQRTFKKDTEFKFSRKSFLKKLLTFFHSRRADFLSRATLKEQGW